MSPVLQVKNQEKLYQRDDLRHTVKFNPHASQIKPKGPLSQLANRVVGYVTEGSGGWKERAARSVYNAVQAAGADYGVNPAEYFLNPENFGDKQLSFDVKNFQQNLQDRKVKQGAHLRVMVDFINQHGVKQTLSKKEQRQAEDIERRDLLQRVRTMKANKATQTAEGKTKADSLDGTAGESKTSSVTSGLGTSRDAGSSTYSLLSNETTSTDAATSTDPYTTFTSSSSQTLSSTESDQSEETSVKQRIDLGKEYGAATSQETRALIHPRREEAELQPAAAATTYPRDQLDGKGTTSAASSQGTIFGLTKAFASDTSVLTNDTSPITGFGDLAGPLASSKEIAKSVSFKSIDDNSKQSSESLREVEYLEIPANEFIYDTSNEFEEIEGLLDSSQLYPEENQPLTFTLGKEFSLDELEAELEKLQKSFATLDQTSPTEQKTGRQAEKITRRNSTGKLNYVYDGDLASENKIADLLTSESFSRALLTGSTGKFTDDAPSTTVGLNLAAQTPSPELPADQVAAEVATENLAPSQTGATRATAPLDELVPPVPSAAEVAAAQDLYQAASGADLSQEVKASALWKTFATRVETEYGAKPSELLKKEKKEQQSYYNTLLQLSQNVVTASGLKLIDIINAARANLRPVPETTYTRTNRRAPGKYTFRSAQAPKK